MRIPTGVVGTAGRGTGGEDNDRRGWYCGPRVVRTGGEDTDRRGWYCGPRVVRTGAEDSENTGEDTG